MRTREEKDFVVPGYAGATDELRQPMFHSIARCAQKSTSYGHFRAILSRNCYLMLHAETGRYVYNREVIPRWKERFGEASVTGS